MAISAAYDPDLEVSQAAFFEEVALYQRKTNEVDEKKSYNARDDKSGCEGCKKNTLESLRSKD